MSALVGDKAELEATIEITRADTGKVEKFRLVGFADKDKLEQFLQKDKADAQDA